MPASEDARRGQQLRAGPVHRTYVASPAFTSNVSAWRHCRCILHLRKHVGMQAMQEVFRLSYIDVMEANGSPSLEPTIF